MYQKEKTAAFSGHRSEKLPKEPGLIRSLKTSAYIETHQAVQRGYDTFIIGVRDGFDFMVAEQLLLIKETAEHLGFWKVRLVAALPENEQSAEEWAGILEKCDEVVTGDYRWMIDQSSLLICFYNHSSGETGDTVAYAYQKEMDVINIHDYDQKE